LNLVHDVLHWRGLQGADFAKNMDFVPDCVPMEEENADPGDYEMEENHVNAVRHHDCNLHGTQDLMNDDDVEASESIDDDQQSIADPWLDIRYTCQVNWYESLQSEQIVIDSDVVFL